MKQFAVIGCGGFGSSVAKTLAELGHEVLAIDNNEEVVQEISEHVTYAVQGDASDEKVLKSLGLENFDVVIINIGDDMQASIMATLIVKEIGAKQVLVKANDDMHAKVLYKIGADRVIFPERDMGIRVAHNLVFSNIVDYIELSPKYNIIEIEAPKTWAGMSIKKLNIRANYGLNIIAIKSGEDINISPYPEDLLKEEDIIVVIGERVDIEKFSNDNLKV